MEKTIFNTCYIAGGLFLLAVGSYLLVAVLAAGITNEDVAPLIFGIFLVVAGIAILLLGVTGIVGWILKKS